MAARVHPELLHGNQEIVQFSLGDPSRLHHLELGFGQQVGRADGLAGEASGRLFVVSSSSHSVTTTRTIPLSQDGYVVFGGLHVTPSGDSAIVATGDPADFNGFQATGVVQMALADGTALHVAELPAPALSSLMVPFGEDEVVTVQAQTVVLTGLADGSPSGSVQLPNVGGVGSLNLAVAPPTTN